MRWTAKNAKNRGYKRLRKTQLYKLKGRKRVAPYFYAFRGLKGTGNITHSRKAGGGGGGVPPGGGGGEGGGGGGVVALVGTEQVQGRKRLKTHCER